MDCITQPVAVLLAGHCNCANIYTIQEASLCTCTTAQVAANTHKVNVKRKQICKNLVVGNHIYVIHQKALVQKTELSYDLTKFTHQSSDNSLAISSFKTLYSTHLKQMRDFTEGISNKE